jgi:hypothetical protein
MSQPHHWGEFTQRRSGPAQPDPAEDFDAICMRALTGAAGQQLIDALRRRYIDAPENPAAPEAVLRVRATQQQFVRDLEAACQRGLEAAKRRAEAAKKPA